MPIFACKTMSSTGATRASRIEAPTSTDASALLQSKGEMVLSVREIGVTRKAGSQSHGRKPSADEVAATVRQISILARAGVPLVEGLRSLAEQTRSATLKDALSQIADGVSQGGALSLGFASYPRIFPNLAVEMAKVAEIGGNLAEAMGKLAEHLERGADIRRKVNSALAYPAVIMCTSLVTVIVLVTFILPRFTKLFGDMGAQIPWTTKGLMLVSHILVSRWYVVVGGSALAAYLILSFLKSPTGRRWLDSTALRLPILGDVVTKIVLSRVVACLSALLSSGVSMTQALETSACAANNEIVKEALLSAKREISDGKAVSLSLQEASVFPPLVLQMVASGEKTGELPAMLDYVCALYNQETEAKVKALTSAIEPILIVVLGLVVGFIAVSVITPIYSLVGGVK